jgi:hypothetical protein
MIQTIELAIWGNQNLKVMAMRQFIDVKSCVVLLVLLQVALQAWHFKKHNAREGEHFIFQKAHHHFRFFFP